MQCCICGNIISGYGNNPYPLCSSDDNESRCCNICNNLVVQARLMSIKSDPSKLEVGDRVVIFWSKTSKKPIEAVAAGNFITGNIESITPYNNTLLCEGSWGDFILDSEADSFIKL